MRGTKQGRTRRRRRAEGLLTSLCSRLVTLPVAMALLCAIETPSTLRTDSSGGTWGSAAHAKDRRASGDRSGNGDFMPSRMDRDRDQSPAQGSGQSQKDSKTSEDKTGGPGFDRD